MPEAAPRRAPGRARARLAAAGALAMLAAACGGSGDPPPAADPPPGPPTAAATADTGPTAPATPSATAAAADGPRVAAPGDTVRVHYHGTLDSGEVFDSSRRRAPLTFTVGSGQVIEGFDTAVSGLAVGESVRVRLEPGQAYGERDPAAVMTVRREGAPEEIAVGDRLQLDNGAVATVARISETEIDLDFNHPLAGTALTFEIELLAIE